MKPRFFQLAEKISKLSNHHKYKVGSVITSGPNVISVGFNQLKTHPKSTHPHKNLHAEMSAILLAKQDLKDCEIYVFRQLKDNTPAMSKPCEYCMTLIQEAGIKKIHFTVNGKYESLKIK